MTKICCFPPSGMDSTENALSQNREMSEILEAQAMQKSGLCLMPFTLNIPRLYLLNNSFFNWLLHYSISQAIGDIWKKLIVQGSIIEMYGSMYGLCLWIDVPESED